MSLRRCNANVTGRATTQHRHFRCGSALVLALVLRILKASPCALCNTWLLKQTMVVESPTIRRAELCSTACFVASLVHRVTKDRRLINQILTDFYTEERSHVALQSWQQ
eukprot:4062605-Amphidinium_carterae.1